MERDGDDCPAARNALHRDGTAVQLDDAMVQEIVQEAKTQMGADYTYEIDNKINPDLIGGFILRVGDKQVDSSIRSKLNRLKKEFDINDYVPKF